MLWLGRIGLVALGALSFALLAYPARADMEVLESNVPRYPRGQRLEGKTIGPLRPGEHVKVLILEENKTHLFEGDPPWKRTEFGIRGPSNQSK
jgi:hypothetical protein